MFALVNINSLSDDNKYCKGGVNMWTERAIEAINERIAEQQEFLESEKIETQIRISEDELIIGLIKQIQEENKRLTFQEWKAEKMMETLK